jgi:uncharacterized protein
MNKLFMVLIISTFLIAIDCYFWQGIKALMAGAQHNTQRLVFYLFFGFTALCIAGIFAYNFLNTDYLGRWGRTIIMTIVSLTYISKMVGLVFLLIDDLVRLLRFGFQKTSQLVSPTETPPEPITRTEFLTKAAVVATAVPFGAFTWGIISGAHDYRIRKVKLTIKDLPAAFEGLTISQISDIHSGSFFNKTAVMGGVEMLNNLKSDLVFFTGDLVNNTAPEVKDYVPVFDKIKAPLGVFSTLGNHDYGDYYRWESPQAKQQNLKDLMASHKTMGFDLLNDTNRKIKIGGEELSIIGVQNISGQARFHTYGNLEVAVQGTQESAVKLLLSHDPTHWDKEVNTKYKDIDVTFSGHTHGAQSGITVAGHTYSPAQWFYKQWAGQYTEGNQHLYVNRGFGYIGYPGRVGMPPEITQFTLTRA